MQGDRLAIVVESSPDVALAHLYLTGELTRRTLALLVRLLEEQLVGGVRRVIVEADRLARLESIALRDLRGCHQRFRDAGGTLLLRGIRLDVLGPPAEEDARDASRSSGSPASPS